MKTSNLLKLSPLILMSVLSAGCSEDQTKAVSTSVPTSMIITASSQGATVAALQKMKPSIFNYIIPQAKALPAPQLLDSSGATVTLSSAWIVLKDIEFKLSEQVGGVEEAEGDEMSFRGPFVVDLMSPNPQPLETKNIAAASIRRVKFKLHEMENLPVGSPTELVGNSIFLRGTIGGVAFSFSSKDGAEINVGGPKGVVPDASSDLLMAFQVANLIKSINLSGISTATDISDSNRVAGVNLCPGIDTSASDLYTCFRKGLEKEAQFGKDSDKSHEIEASEDSVEDNG